MLPNKRILEIAGLITEVEYKFHIDISEPIKLIFNAFHKNNKKLYVVGGAVRDAVLGQKPKDFDLATDAVPTEVQKILVSSGIYNFPKGESFGVISAVIDSEEFEIATFRSEDYTGSDGRRPNVDSIVYTDMKADAARRDLTINALYYDIEAGVIIDLVGGMEDIKNKRIRTVGSPMDRFTEDRLRTLRALRFAHRFGSTLDKDTIDAIIHYKDLPGVSGERIRDEFMKALASSKKPEEFVKQFASLGLMARTFPGLEIDLSIPSGVRNHVVVITKLLGNNDKKKLLKTLEDAKYSGHERDTIGFLIDLKSVFNDFDKLVFDPTIDGQKLMNLIPKRELALSRGMISHEDIMTYAKITGLNQNVIHSFLIFKPKFTAADFPNLKDRELGMQLTVSNSNYFLEKI